MENKRNAESAAVFDRAQGCLLGQLAGDALGSLVEFKTPGVILRLYPDGVRVLADGGTWNTLAGQPTDDSEMALMLARTLAAEQKYNQDSARAAYLDWLESDPFDCGMTVAAGLRGRPNGASQANGALMRVSPLGIFGARHSLEQVAKWAREDAAITHPHPICLDANALFAMSLSYAIKSGPSGQELYGKFLAWADDMRVQPELMAVIQAAAEAPPADYVQNQGWVLIAFQNALWQMLHAPSLEEGMVDTVMRGGDTDTNAAICGALLGAIHGRAAMPEQWVKVILNCRPQFGQPHVHRPRPECFWPVDALQLASQLLGV